MMKKIYYYTCGHERTIQEKTPPKELRQCNICGAHRRDRMTVFCEKCNEPVEATLQSGPRIRWCRACAKKKNIERTKINWAKHKEKYNEKRKVKATALGLPNMIRSFPSRADSMVIVNQVIEELREKYAPPK